ncbi:MAG: PilZ domain-containing protein [Myxococcota bacterium]
MDEQNRARARVKTERISVRFMADGAESVGYLKNVSRAGIFIRAQDLPRPGAAVALQFRSPSGVLVDLRGEVRWNTHGLTAVASAGFGVAIQEPSREYVEFFLWALERSKDEEKETGGTGFPIG